MDYEAALRALARPLHPAEVGQAILDALGRRYQEQWAESALFEFEQNEGRFVFDLATSGGLDRADRTVAACALTPQHVAPRDVNYQRNFPLPPSPTGQPLDRGHLIPHLSGGTFGPNIFPQDRPLNRGWSSEGRRYRALEREAASEPGRLYFGHLLYDDDTDFPFAVETGVLRGDILHVEHFVNRTASN